MFNAIQYTKTLEASGFSREQAEAQVTVLSEIMDSQLATKSDLKALESKFDFKIANLESKLETLENRLILKLGTIMGVMLTLAISILAQIIHR